MSDKMREEFEKVAERGLLDLEVSESGYYRNSTTSEYWSYWVESWQASRQAIKVKLPDILNATFCDAYELESMKESLNTAGVSYE